MKWSVALVALALALGLAAGALYAAAARGGQTDEASVAAIREALRTFTQQRAPELELGLADLPQWQADPALVVGRDGEAAGATACEPQSSPAPPQAESAKLAQWRDFVANPSASLPEEYFREPPYVHPSGHSYAALALVTRPETFRRLPWWRRHKSYLRVVELQQVAAGRMPLSAVEQLAAELSTQQLGALSAETELLIPKGLPRVLVRQEQGDGERPARYAAFALESWQHYLRSTAFVAAPLSDRAACLGVVGQVCFKRNPDHTERQLTQATMLGASSIGLLGVAAVLALFRRARAKRREQQARLLVLQTLTHELRTPVTTIQLSLEPMRRAFDELPEASQSAFLRMCDAVQRLGRVIEASKQYLQGHQDGRAMQLRDVEVSSMVELLEGVVEGYDGTVRLKCEVEDTAVKLDPYWIGTCVRNLVDNALQHGAEPVVVRLQEQGDDLVITVQDAGELDNVKLPELTTPFHRREGSEGLGLGLAVVDRVVRSMGGELQLELQPTRFRIQLRHVRTAV